MANSLLEQAVAFIKAGNKSQGRQLLIQVLAQDSKNELAWLWLSQCVSSNEQKLDCLKRVLGINPNNAQAKEEIARIQTLSKINLQPQQPVQPARSVQPIQPKKKGKSSNLLAYILIAVVFGCLCLFAIIVLLGGGGGVNTSGGDTSAWVPSGFEKWNNEIAIRFAEGKACSYGTVEACAHYEVFARYGCPTSLYVEVAFMNSGGTQVDWSNDYATSLSPGTKALLEFVSFESTATKVKVTKIECY